MNDHKHSFVKVAGSGAGSSSALPEKKKGAGQMTVDNYDDLIISYQLRYVSSVSVHWLIFSKHSAVFLSKKKSVQIKKN